MNTQKNALVPENGSSSSAQPDILLKKLLVPLSKYYESGDTVEVRMVKQGFVTIDVRGAGKSQIEAPELSIAKLETICKSLSNHRGQKFDVDSHPKLSCVLPGGHRFECVLGDSVQSSISLAIRCKHPFTPTWEQVVVNESSKGDLLELNTPIWEQVCQNEDPIKNYLIKSVLHEKNMMISGGTNTGKTTLLNKLLNTLPDDRRVVALEDTPELHIQKFWDGVGLLAERETTGESGMLSYRQLYDHLMRITPDHPIFGEISTLNSFAALSVLNAGMTGFMCTIHAGSPYQAIHRKFDQNIAWSGETMPRVPEFLSELVDVVVQIKRTSDGFRRITDIYEPINDRFILEDGVEVVHKSKQEHAA